jgi:hypothetical protein
MKHIEFDFYFVRGVAQGLLRSKLYFIRSFFLERAGELCIIILRRREVQNRPTVINTKQASLRRTKTKKHKNCHKKELSYNYYSGQMAANPTTPLTASSWMNCNSCWAHEDCPSKTQAF